MPKKNDAFDETQELDWLAAQFSNTQASVESVPADPDAEQQTHIDQSDATTRFEPGRKAKTQVGSDQTTDSSSTKIPLAGAGSSTGANTSNSQSRRASYLKNSDGLPQTREDGFDSAGPVNEETLGQVFPGEFESDESKYFKSVRTHSSAVGFTVGEYTIVGELGRGGMGVVYRAKHKTLGRDVALKMILTGEHASQESVSRFIVEARSVAQLQHKNIVQIFDIGEHNGLPYFSLEFVDGESLKELIADEPLTSRDAAKILLTLAEAIQYAHDHNIIHRDIKPANILVSTDGTPKISDFGLAKDVDSDSGTTREGQVMGTPSYMSPEQAQGQIRDLGPATDQYSLGAMLYRLITGRPPFAATKPIETMMQVVNNEPLSPRQIQPAIEIDLETICLKTLQKNPEARYASCKELAEDLRRFLNDEPINARPTGSAERAWRWCRRNPQVAFLSAASVALLVGIAALSSWSYFTVSTQKNIIQKEKEYAISQEKIAKEQTMVALKTKKIALTQASNSLQVIQETLVNVNDKLAGDPKLDDLRVEILSALSTSLDLVDPAVLEDEQGQAIPTLMAIRKSMIDVFSANGRFEEAMRDSRLIYEMAQRRLVVKGRTDAARMNMAIICGQFARIVTKVDGESDEVRRLHEEGIDLLREIILTPNPVEPNEVEQFRYDYLLGAALQNYGAHLLSVGKPELFNSTFEEAAQVFSLLLDRLDTDPEFLALPEEKQQAWKLNTEQSLKRVKLGLAADQMKSGQLDEAFGIFDELILAAKAKVEVEEPNPMDRVLYSQINDYVGFKSLVQAIYQDENKAAYLNRADELTKTALEVTQGMANDYPKNSDIKYRLGLAHYRRGLVLEAQGLTDDATVQFENSRDVRTQQQLDSPSEKHLNMLMMAQARCGDWESAKQVADDAKLAEPISAKKWVLIARGYALSSAADGAPATELKSSALQAIEQAIAGGFSDWYDLTHEPDLKAIQSEEQFTTMVAPLKPSNE